MKSTLRMRLWLENDEGMILGMGRVMLLAKVAELGSLNKAAKALNMSYRAAWGRMKEAEARLGQALLAKDGPRSGYVLTPLGQSFVDNYLIFQRDVEAYALDKAREIFGWDIEPYGEMDIVDPDS